MHTKILLPQNALAELADRATLWNAVEKIEKANNSQLAREIEIALPLELTQAQNINLVRQYVNQHFVQAGMWADIAIHDTGSGKVNWGEATREDTPWGAIHTSISCLQCDHTPKKEHGDQSRGMAARLG